MGFKVVEVMSVGMDDVCGEDGITSPGYKR
jgi:hypothetical protein